MLRLRAAPRLASPTHLSTASSSGIRMVDVSTKVPSPRRATASCRISNISREVTDIIMGESAKGPVALTAQVAGVQAAKRTADLIPLCHNIRLDFADVQLARAPGGVGVHLTSEVACRDATGVEMEALTAVSIAALTVYDMVKSVCKDAVITDIRLETKSGGKSGHFVRSDSTKIE